MSENLKIAQELGIENAESLSASQLKKAIDAAKAKAEVPAEEASSEEFISIDEIEAANVAAQEEVLAILSEYLGVDDIRSLDVETVKALLADKETEEAASIEVVIDAEEGKTNESFTASNGKEYVFTPDAPAAFRCFGTAKTQKEWLEDTDSMELLVAGNLSFLTLKK